MNTSDKDTQIHWENAVDVPWKMMLRINFQTSWVVTSKSTTKFKLTAKNILCTIKQCYFLNHSPEVDLTSVKTTLQVEEKGLVSPKSSHSLSVIMGLLQKRWMSLVAAGRLIGKLLEAFLTWCPDWIWIRAWLDQIAERNLCTPVCAHLCIDSVPALKLDFWMQGSLAFDYASQ